MENLHKNILQYEDLIVQSNLDGFYNKREKLSLKPHNHRKVAVTEIVIDIDSHIRQISNEIVNVICSRLIADKMGYTLWDTSRSPHIHLFFKDLCKYPKETRKELRKEFLRHYGKGYKRYIDMGKCSEDVMIRDFNCVHEKTGKRKICIEQFKGQINAIPAHIVEKVLNHSQSQQSALKPIVVSSKAELQAFVAYCLCHRFDKDGGRNQILFKNFAIAIYLLGIASNEAKPYFQQMALNCRGKRDLSLIQWFKWAEKKQCVEVSFKELKKANFYNEEVKK